MLIYILPDGKIRFFTRKKTPLPRYKAPAALLKSLHALKLKPGFFHVLDGGLLHYKTERVKNTIVLWDILVHESQFLTGTGYGERYKLLEKITGKPKTAVRLDGIKIALKIAPSLWLAPLLEGDWKKLYQESSALPEIEGLVLKDPKEPLKRALKPEENARWQIRARKPRIDYRF